VNCKTAAELKAISTPEMLVDLQQSYLACKWENAFVFAVAATTYNFDFCIGVVVSPPVPNVGAFVYVCAWNAKHYGKQGVCWK
jgi:hypothetical protein